MFILSQCGICGEPHATRDCPLAPSKTAQSEGAVPGMPLPPQVNMDEVCYIIDRYLQ